MSAISPKASTAAAPAGFPEFDAEVASTRRMLAAFPDGRGEWKPHHKSRSAGALATHVAMIPQLGCEILSADFRDIAGRKPAEPANTAAALLAIHDANCAALRAQLLTASEERLEDQWSLRLGDKVITSGTRRSMLRTMVMSHVIHHRAQLGVYYRLMDVRVPGMYGPSADEGPPS